MSGGNKRFFYAHGIIFDTEKPNTINKIGVIKDLDTGLRIVDWLNALHEENGQLKDKIEDLEAENYTIMKRVEELVK